MRKPPEPEIDTRLTPFDDEAELATLGDLCMVGQDFDRFDRIASGLPVAAFLNPERQALFGVLCEMRRANKPMDGRLIVSELKAQKLDEAIGGRAFIEEVKGCASGNGIRFASVVLAKYQLREAISACRRAIDRCYDPQESEAAGEILTSTAEQLANLAATGKSDTIRTIGDGFDEVIAAINSGKGQFLPTGLRDFDAMVFGLPVGGFSIFAADSRTGKSLAMKDIARRMALAGIPVGIISLEENLAKISGNVLAADSNVEARDIARGVRGYAPGELTDFGYNAVLASATRLHDLPVFIDESAGTIEQIEVAISKLRLRYHCQVIMVDHFHLIDLGNTVNETAMQASVSHRLKAAFKRNNVAGAVACQINKSGISGERPTHKQISGSGKLFNDADLVVMLYREDFELQRKWISEKRPGPYIPTNCLEMIVEKNKNGQSGTVCVEVDNPHQRLNESIVLNAGPGSREELPF